jgi:hypothetical protein
MLQISHFYHLHLAIGFNCQFFDREIQASQLW